MANNFLYRLAQKIVYHTTSSEIRKRVAEINRFKQFVKLNSTSFKIKECPLNFNLQQHFFVLESFDLFQNLLKQQHLKFLIEKEVLKCLINGNIQLGVTTSEELFIINEIWVEGVYNADINTSNQIIVIDVGMNVAYASLFFATNNQVQHIYAFEPFTPTYNQALANLKENIHVNNKITPYNFGLSHTDQELHVNYSPNHRGRMGIWGTELVLEKVNQVVKEKLVLKEFNTSLSEIINKHPNCEFIWKIDCEGSEYDIFEKLDPLLLKNVRAVLMEWHTKGPQNLNQILKDNGFSTLTFNPLDKKTGMLYAFK